MSAEIHAKEPGGQEAGKTNTVLLLDQHGKFVAFGSKALKSYFENNHEGSDLLFEKFKMCLHGNKGDQVTQATALNGNFLGIIFFDFITSLPQSMFTCRCAFFPGQTLPLLTIITKTLEYVKDEALREINKSQIVPLKLDEIQWVVTVPAIWSDAAKVSMAGLNK